MFLVFPPEPNDSNFGVTESSDSSPAVLLSAAGGGGHLSPSLPGWKEQGLRDRAWLESQEHTGAARQYKYTITSRGIQQ